MTLNHLYSNLEQSLEFAQLVADKMKGGPIPTNRGVSQDPFLVLWKTAMPAVLIEIGFLSNSSDLAALRSASNRDKIATRLFNAFKEYKTRYDGSLSLDVELEGEGEAAPKPAQQDAGEPETQGKLYKYVIAVEDSAGEAKAHLGEIRKKYPDSFLVKIEGETVSLVK